MIALTPGRKIPKTLSGIETPEPSYTPTSLWGRKIPKTLSGIETITTIPDSIPRVKAGKYLKPYQGLKRILALVLARGHGIGRKIPKTLSGIETLPPCRHPKGDRKSRKIPKTLSGIETGGMLADTLLSEAGKYLKPYQGLKLIVKLRGNRAGSPENT